MNRKENVMSNSNKNIQELLKLIKENPTLPIIPMVEYDVVGEDYGSWMGKWGKAHIDRYLLPPDSERPIIFENDYTVGEVIERWFSDEELEKLPDNEVEWQKIYDNLPWTKAIIVRISVPDEYFD